MEGGVPVGSPGGWKSGRRGNPEATCRDRTTQTPSRTILKVCRSQVCQAWDPRDLQLRERFPASLWQSALALTHKLCLIPEFQSLENKPLSHCLAPASAGKWGAGGREASMGRGVDGLGAAKGALRGERGQRSRTPPFNGSSREGPPACNPLRDCKAFLRERPVSP